MENSDTTRVVPIYKDTKIYVYAPANAATGGPELLHQLAYKLRQVLGFDAYMYYLPNNLVDPVHREYKGYNNPFVSEPEDREQNILVIPETVDIRKIVKKFPRIRKVFWWLSVNNYYNALPYLVGRLNRFISFKLDKQNSWISFTEIPKSKVVHLVQSLYAADHLHQKGLDSSYLSDFLNRDFIASSKEWYDKDDIVVYNPQKGKMFTARIIKRAKGLRFVPIQNMSRSEVVQLLSKAKVYIDFGNHPGKDRIPREAAVLGCCVITGRKGAANYDDVGIPEEYKFNDVQSAIDDIVLKIKECLDNYGEKHAKFSEYRERICREESNFEKDIKRIFVRADAKQAH